jgi:cytochrome c oxidase subunit 4
MFRAEWLLNLGSLLCGIIAWLLPLVGILGVRKYSGQKLAVISVLSVIACAVSLYLQILYTNFLVNNEDWSALADTRSASAFVSAVLLVITIALNIITVILYRKKLKRD